MEVEQPQKTQQQQQNLHFGKFSIVFLLIKTAQNSYGIKGADYARYRRYCSHKIFKLRKALGIKLSNKNKFLHRNIAKQKSNDSKILQVLLFNAEKNWAFANQSKFSATRKPSQKSRGKFFSLKKLSRALRWVAQLKQVCKAKTDNVTQLQVQAYELFLSGSFYFQKQEWQAAQSRLIACRQIISDLSKVSDSLSQKVFKEKIDQIEQTIKFCNFKVSKGKELSITEIVDLRKNGDATLSDLIQSLAQKRLSQIKLGDDKGQIHFGSERYPIKQELIIKQKAKIDANHINLNEIKKKALASLQDDHLYEQLLSFYSNLVIETQEAIKLCDSERQDPKKKEKYTQGQLQILKKVAFLFHQIKFKLFIDRNLTIFKFSYNTNRGRKSTSQTIAKLLTATISLFQELGQVIKQKGQISNTFDIQQIQQIDAKNFYLRSIRLLFVGQVYFNNGKLREAYGLWSQCQRCIKILQSKQQMNESMSDDKFIGSLISLKDLSELVITSKLKSVITNFEAQETKKEDVSKKINEIQIDEQKTDNLHSTSSLQTLIMDRSSGNAMLSLQQISKIPIIQLPGRPQPIPTRPIFFDIFNDNLQYPDLSKKLTESKAKTSWWGRIFK